MDFLEFKDTYSERNLDTAILREILEVKLKQAIEAARVKYAGLTTNAVEV